MKKYKCNVCGNTIKLTESNIIKCPYCQAEYNYQNIIKKNKIKTLQNDISILLINKEYNKADIYLIQTYNNLLLEYYRMFINKQIKKLDNNEFYKLNYLYTNEELDILIKHMIENNKYFTIEEINKVINLSEDKSKYQAMLKMISNSDQGKGIELDLRYKLFNKTKIVVQKESDKNKREGLSYIYIGIILLIFFFMLVLIATNKTIKFELTNICLILPCMLLTTGVSRILMKNKNIFVSFGIFLIIYYVLTIPGFLIYKDIETNFFIDHILGVINSPVDLMVKLLGEMKYEM